jgi:hypothetical protein
MHDKKGLLDRSNEAIGLATRSPTNKSNKGVKSQMVLNDTGNVQSFGSS